MALYRSHFSQFFLVMLLFAARLLYAQPEEETWDELEYFQNRNEPYHIFADSLDSREQWNQERLTTLVGNVRLVQGDLTLKADKAWIYHKAERTLLEGNVHIIDERGEITADYGTYDRAKRFARLRGNVHAADSVYSITSQFATYDQPSQVAVADKQVQLTDTQNHITLTGDRLRYERTLQYAVMTGSPKLVRHAPEDTSTITITAEKMELFQTERKAVATGNVVIERDEMTATCLVATYYDTDERLVLAGKPQAKQGQNEMAADEIRFFFADRHLKRVELQGNSQAFYLPADSLAGEIPPSTVAGDSIGILFENDQIQQIDIAGHALSVYFPDDPDQRGNWNRSQGEHIRLLMQDGKPERIKIEGGAAGTYQFLEKGNHERNGKSPL
ncbi:MAG: hypothetical protein D6675_11010 [Gemmatimonadetes bacterium]|nr:MAG: hypothetical protein D6675_11010 [Gemmatimonadota bacterium]